MELYCNNQVQKRSPFEGIDSSSNLESLTILHHGYSIFDGSAYLPGFIDLPVAVPLELVKGSLDVGPIHACLSKDTLFQVSKSHTSHIGELSRRWTVQSPNGHIHSGSKSNKEGEIITETYHLCSADNSVLTMLEQQFRQLSVKGQSGEI